MVLSMMVTSRIAKMTPLTNALKKPMIDDGNDRYGHAVNDDEDDDYDDYFSCLLDSPFTVMQRAQAGEWQACPHLEPGTMPEYLPPPRVGQLSSAPWISLSPEVLRPLGFFLNLALTMVFIRTC